MTALLEIDLGAVAANWIKLDAMHPGETAGVVKADAYGLGAAQIGPALYKAGCRVFFTAYLAEAVALRAVLPQAEILVLNGLRHGDAAILRAHRLVPVLNGLAEIELWAAAGEGLACGLHFDTGMNRLGITAAEAGLVPERLAGLRPSLLMTHLAAAEIPGDAMNARQLQRFRKILSQFAAGVRTSIANSSGIFLGAEFQADLVRPGAALYGINPTPGAPNPMRHVVTLRAPILQIREIEPGEAVGYNGIWRAARKSRVATIGLGYADGYQRSLTNAGTAYFDDTPIPLVGRVSMDLTSFDVTDVPARPGDVLRLLGPGHDQDALAAQAHTNGYEILTSLGRRYARRYVGA